MRSAFSKTAFVCFVVIILFLSCSLAKAADSSKVFPLQTLSAMPAPVGIYVVVFAVFTVFVITSVVYAYRKAIRKRLKAVAVVGLIVVAAMVSFGVVWSAEASIGYWFVAEYTYPPAGDNFLTLYCENTGYLTATFNLVIQFTNANFSTATSQPYQQLNSQTAQFTYTLRSGEKQSTQVHFTIYNKVTDFYISLSFHQNGANFLVKSNPGGVDSVSYQKDPNSDNFTMRAFVPPP